MKFRNLVLRIGPAFVLMLLQWNSLGLRVGADSLAPQLVINQFKITSSNGQFVMLYNQTASSLDLTKFELDYTSSSGKTSSVAIGGSLPSHQYYILADDTVPLCYKSIVSATSLGFTTTSGTLQLWQVATTSSSKLMTLQDSVSWVNKAGNATTSPLLLSSAATTASYLRKPDSADASQVLSPGSGTWANVTPSATDPCALMVAGSTGTTTSAGSSSTTPLTAGLEPPATVISVASADTAAANVPMLPLADVGLSAPQITELLPNPDGTGNDDSDEFIELYNPNPTDFHLVGFTLQTGSTTKHSYTFPDGTILPSDSFVAFYSSDTGLSLSNTSGQADLLDPFGNQLAQTDAYGTAKDGQSWALANGTWYWTSQLTPNAANVIKQAAAATTSKSKTSTSKSSSTAAKTAPKSTAKGTTASSGSSSGAADTAATPAPIHPLILAAVIILAVGYGVYEYRHDIANTLYRFRRDRAVRRTARA